MALTLTSPLGGTVTPKFEAGGVSELYLVHYNDVITYSGTTDDFGADIAINSFTLASGATFQQVKIVKDATSVNDGFKLAGSKKFYNVVIGFSVDASGSVIIGQNHQVILGGPYVVLYKRRNKHYYVAGLTDGLECTQLDANSGAKPEDESANVYQLTGINLGQAPEYKGLVDATLVTKFV